MSEPAVLARGWGWRYPGREDWALREVDLRIDEGERVLLLGPSGSGKSTLLLALAGLLDASGADEVGELRVRGTTPLLARPATGLVLQDPDAQLVMARAGDDVAFGLENRRVPTAAIWPRVHRALADVAFPYPEDRPTAALSGGEKQRLAIAGILALDPRLLLLDEPSANLDAAGTAAVYDVLRRITAPRGITTVLVEHRVTPAIGLVDRVLVLAAGGGIVADGPPERVFAGERERLRCYGVWLPGERVPPRRGAPDGEAIVASGVAFRYPSATSPAVDGVDATVRRGGALAIVGPNGSGKSTLAFLLAGLLPPSRGHVSAFGDEPARLRPRALVRRIGTVFQNPEHQFVTERVADEVRAAPLAAGMTRDDADRRADELLERLHLARLAAANPFTLSGGEKRRLSVGSALAASPGALVLDEPTFGQDRATFDELLDLLAAYRDGGGAVAFASHDELLVDAFADERLVLGAGRAA